MGQALRIVGVSPMKVIFAVVAVCAAVVLAFEAHEDGSEVQQLETLDNVDVSLPQLPGHLLELLETGKGGTELTTKALDSTANATSQAEETTSKAEEVADAAANKNDEAQKEEQQL